MENQPAKRRAKDHDDDVGSFRISELPESVLLHILCFLSQKKALQTSVLSKSWRHLGSTRPVIKLRGSCSMFSHVRGINRVCENCFNGNKKAFLSRLENTFQRYHDQNIFTQELHLVMLDVESKSISVLEKWIPIFINPDKPALTTFSLSFSFECGPYYNLPSVVFRAESLQNLCLYRCRLNEIISIDNFMLKNLLKLSLSRVEISDKALEKMISGCPLVKRVVMHHCEGFKTINIGNRNRYLSCFEFSSLYGDKIGPSIEIDVPALQSIHIVGCSNWYHNHINYFPHLKSLFLFEVKLSAESFDNFSCNFPRLEELRLVKCSGFKEIKLSSRSIKRIIIHEPRRTSAKKVAIEVPNILYFEFFSSYLPTTLSLATTSREWKSHLNFYDCVYAYGEDVLQRILKLFEIVKALSQSQISLTLSETLNFKINQIEWDFNDHPVVVEHLGLDIHKLCPDSLTHFLNALFRVFRPRYTNAMCEFHEDDKEVTEFLWKTLIHEREQRQHGWEQHLEKVSIKASQKSGKLFSMVVPSMFRRKIKLNSVQERIVQSSRWMAISKLWCLIEKRQYGWEQHLEVVSVEASDKKGKVWYHVKWTCLPEWSNNQRIRFRLKWRDQLVY